MLELRVRARVGVADGTGEITAIGDFQQCEATVLLMVGAKAAVIGAAAIDGCVELTRHVAGFDKFLAEFVIFNVIGDQDIFTAMNGAMLVQIDGPVLEDDLGFDFREAFGTDTVGQSIE